MRGSFFTLRNFTYPQLNWGFNHAYSAPITKKALSSCDSAFFSLTFKKCFIGQVAAVGIGFGDDF